MILSVGRIDSKAQLAKATLSVDEFKLLASYWQTTMYKIADEKKGIELWIHVSDSELKTILEVLNKAYEARKQEEELDDVYI